MQYTTDEKIEELKKEIAAEKLKPAYLREKRKEEKREKNGQVLNTQQKIADIKKKSALKFIGNIIFILLVISLLSILVSIIVMKNSGQTPKLFGYQLLVVETGSMTPTLPVGTVILVKEPKDPAAIKVGTIASFERDGNTVTHRIVEVEKVNNSVMYRTKGDNPQNSIDIKPVLPKDIKGVFVLKFPIPL